MADEPRKVGVYDRVGAVAGQAGGKSIWWILGLIVLLIVLAFLLF